MDTAHDSTLLQQAAGVEDESVELKRQRWAQDQFITFCASSGISTDEDGNFTYVTVKQFAAAIGYDRSRLYQWKKEIPGFWSLVDQRAREIFNGSTKYAIFKGLKLKAMLGDVKAAEFVLSHYSDYTPPAQKHEVKLTGWGDMVRDARKRAIKANRPVQEAEVVPMDPPNEVVPVIPHSTETPKQLPTAPTPVQQPLSTPLSTPVIV
jgi:hypothetical protein